MECQFCEKILSNIYSLKNHQKTAKFCLQKQGKINEINFECECCYKKFTTKDNLNTHTKICKERIKEENNKEKECHLTLEKIKKEYKLELDNKEKECHSTLEKIKKEYKLELDNKEKEYNSNLEKIKKEYKLEIDKIKDEYKLELDKTKEKLFRLEGKLSILENNKECLYDIAKQPKITNTNNNNKILSITSHMDFNNTEHVKKLIEEKYDTKYLFQGQKGVAQFAVDYILKDDNGELRYVCTDPSRQIFKYKDSEGFIKKDVEAKKLTGFLVNSGIQEKTHNVAIDFWTDDDGEINGEKCSSLLEPAQSVKNINTDNTVFKKELVNIICI